MILFFSSSIVAGPPLLLLLRHITDCGKSLPIGSSDEPLLRRRLDHVVQLQPGGGELLGGGLVLPLAPPPPPRHDQEDEEAGGGDEEGAAHHGANDQGDVARARGGLLGWSFLYRLMLPQNSLAHRCSSRGSDYKAPPSLWIPL